MKNKIYFLLLGLAGLNSCAYYSRSPVFRSAEPTANPLQGEISLCWSTTDYYYTDEWQGRGQEAQKVTVKERNFPIFCLFDGAGIYRLSDHSEVEIRGNWHSWGLPMATVGLKYNFPHYPMISLFTLFNPFCLTGEIGAIVDLKKGENFIWSFNNFYGHEQWSEVGGEPKDGMPWCRPWE
jgi:hypothetical protein